MCAFYIDDSRHLCYNVGMVEKSAPFYGRPPHFEQTEANSMAISKAQQRATANYVKKSYDRIEVKVAKGKKEIIQEHAEQHGESLNAFINRAITETMERDQEGTK